MADGEPDTTATEKSRAIPDVELFTHPVCSGCGDAIVVLSELSQRGVIKLRLTSIAASSGQRRAQELGVTTVPTVHFGGEYHVLMRKQDLADLVESIRRESPVIV
ncbi:MAG: hypothetical protein ACYDD0_03250 [Candidatus Dormibacteria bacterium]